MSDKKCIIIANGDMPFKRHISLLFKNGYSDIFCADGGANSAFKLGIVPKFIVGDLDSINPKVRKNFSNKSKIIHLKRQNDTDLEKCIKIAIRLRYKHAIILGGIGDRLDHSFCNLGIVNKYFPKINIKIVYKKSILYPAAGNLMLNSFPGEIISLYGIDDKTTISSQGLHFKLNRSKLPFGLKDGTSNYSESSKVKLKIAGGIIYIIRDFKLMCKYDFI